MKIKRRKNEKDDKRCKKETAKLGGLEQVYQECSQKSLCNITVQISYSKFTHCDVSPHFVKSKSIAVFFFDVMIVTW